MPILQLSEIINMLHALGIQSRVGVIESDIDELYKPYYEQWLANRDGFIKILTGYIDYVGTEEIMRLGPFHNMYCLIHNSHLMETHPDHPKLLNALLFYKLNKGKVNEIGWNGSILAERLNNDNILCSRISRNNEKQQQFHNKTSNKAIREDFEGTSMFFKESSKNINNEAKNAPQNT